MKRDPAGEIDPIDREGTKVVAAARDRPVDPAIGVETEVERGSVDCEFGRADFAAHQRTQAEFDIELVGPDFAKITGAADLNRVQAQQRHRQQPRIEFAADPHRYPQNPAGFSFELRAILIPVDE